MFVKSISLKGGLVDTRRFQNTLKVLIESGKAKPSFVFDKKFDIKDANKAYKSFSDHKIIKGYFSFDSDKEDATLSSSDATPSDREVESDRAEEEMDVPEERHGHSRKRKLATDEEAPKTRKIQIKGHGRKREAYRS